MNGIGVNSPEAQEYLGNTFTIIEIARTVVDALPDPAEKGSRSAIIEEELDLQVLSFYQTLRFSIQQSIGALKSIQTLILHEGEKFVPPMQSLLRTALLSSARVNWVLFPEDSEKNSENASRLMAVELKNLQLAVRNSSKFEHLLAVKARPDHVEAIEEEYERLRQARRVTDTNLLEEFSGSLEAWLSTKGIDPEGILNEVTTWMWNTGSASAHGMGWTKKVGASNANAPGDFNADYNIVASFAHAAADTLLRASTFPVRTGPQVMGRN